jgi:hypothetical protein
MHELVTNLHMHTTYSDGSGTHADLARAALRTGVDVIMVTDHNVLVQGVEQYHREGKRRLLLLAGEEIHDQDRQPQKNHLLVFGADRELSTQADDPQTLIDAVHRSGGICFIAHPVDPALPAFGEGDISWVDWEVQGFNGLEIWNGFSEIKSVAKGKLDGLFFGFFPETIARGPLPETLRRWDELIAGGSRVVAIGGSDAHASKLSMGPLRKTIFPYEFHFSAINTHLLTPSALSGNISRDRKMILEALASGHCFVGYDLSAPTRGFRFSAQGKEMNVIMGDEIPSAGSITLQTIVPAPADIRLLKDGQTIKTVHGEGLAHVTNEPGGYRVEAYRRHLGRLRGWIFSNPIYVK